MSAWNIARSFTGPERSVDIPQRDAKRSESPAIAQKFSEYEKTVRQVLDNTKMDAAYGVMMMGAAEDSFAQLRLLLAQRSERSQELRGQAVQTLLAGFAQMRLTFFVLASAGAIFSILAALLIARAISKPTVRLTRTMAVLAAGDIAVEIPDQERRDEIGAMAKAVEVFKQNAGKMKGVLSDGMLFDIGYADSLVPVLAMPERPVPDGTRAG